MEPAALIGAALLAAPAPSAQATALPRCEAVEVRLGVGAEQSRWQEVDATGRRLVDESGTLAGASVMVDGLCAGRVWGFGLRHRSGTRDYAGTSSTGSAIRTSSRIGELEVSLGAWQPLATGISAGGRLVAQAIDRDIASKGSVLGYPEQYRLWRGEVGARWDWSVTGAWATGAHAWLGAGPAGRMHIEVPTYDPAVLQLGSSHSAAIGVWAGSGDAFQRSEHMGPSDATPFAQPLAARVPGYSRWGWWVQAGWMQQTLGAGPPQALTRNGIVVGAAAQPKTTMRSMDVVIALSARL